jgi:hypothetical protein
VFYGDATRIDLLHAAGAGRVTGRWLMADRRCGRLALKLVRGCACADVSGPAQSWRGARNVSHYYDSVWTAAVTTNKHPSAKPSKSALPAWGRKGDGSSSAVSACRRASHDEVPRPCAEVAVIRWRLSTHLYPSSADSREQLRNVAMWRNAQGAAPSTTDLHE